MIKLFESCYRLQTLPELAPFRAWLAAELQKETELLIGASEDRVMHLAQGAVRKLGMILDLIENSGKNLEKRRG